MLRLVRQLPLLMATVVLSGCDWAEMAGSPAFKEDFNYSYNFAPGGRISVESFNGSIEVDAWDKNEVEIRGTKYASSEELLQALKVDVVATDTMIQVRTIRPSGRRGSMGARYVIHTPKKVEVDRLDSSNGTITITGTEGSARLKTSNGRIQVKDVRGDIEAETSNGGVDVSESGGNVVIRTSNGAVNASAVRGHLRATTSNGSIKARLLGVSDGRPVELRSSNGSITLTLLEQPTSDVLVSTSNSSITVYAPDSLRANLKASTSNSSVNSDFEMMVKGSQSKNRMEGTINGGGPRLELESSNGGVRLLKGEAEANN